MSYSTSVTIAVLLIVIDVCTCVTRKNILFIVADDLRPQLGSYVGNDFPSKVHPPMYTPNIDKLAAKSLLLKRAYVQHAVCSPSRASFLTGRRPDTTHVYDLVTNFRDVGGNFTTIPQYFKSKGYISTGMGKIFHEGPASGNNDDIISWTEPYFHAGTHWEETPKLETSWKAVPDHHLINNPLQDEQIAKHAISKLRQLAPDAKAGRRHFFAAVGFHRPHLPLVFPESVLQHYPFASVQLPDNEYAPVNMPKIAWSPYEEIRHFNDIKSLNVSGAINTTLPRNVTIALRRAYYSSVTWMDSLVGRVLDELETLGLADNTIVSFLGDHGWQLGEHGEWCKHTNFEIATHAPMMIHIPGLTDTGIVTEKLTEMVDLFPTLVEAAGFDPLDMCPHNSSSIELCREGESLIPLIHNPYAPWKNASFSQFRRYLNHRTKTVMGYTIRTNDYRYTEWVLFSWKTYSPIWHDVYGVELYDHGVDSDENNNVALIESYADAKRELRSQLHSGWRHSLPLGSLSSTLFG